MKYIRFSLKIFGSIALILLFANFSKKKVYQCKQQKSPVEINQNEFVWGGDYSYDSKTGIYYGITYDDEQLYVVMKTSDDILKHKIIKAGLNLWIDTNARGKEQLGLMFPVKHNFSTNIIMNDKNNFQNKNLVKEKTKEEIKKFNNRYLNSLELVDIIGFDGQTELTTYKNLSENGINAFLHINSTEYMYYFASIPMDMVFNNPTEYLNNPDRYFSFSFKTNEMEMPSGGGPPNGGGRSGGGRSGGGGGPGGGGHGGGGPGGDRNPDNAQMAELMKPVEFTMKKASLYSGK